jgi:polyisoprenoid-binding protein YceI
MTRRTILIALAVGLIAVGAGFWWVFIRSDAPPPVSLQGAVSDVTATTAAGNVSTTTTTRPSTTAADEGPQTGVDGTWTIDTSASFAGYRVQEELSGIGSAEAVGRTSELVGELTIDGELITGVDVEVDMTTLQSDRSRRDSALSTRGLETSQFPTATFGLTQPIQLDGVPTVGDTIVATATGELTLHGVTREVEIPIEGEFVDAATIVVVGSLDVMITDHGIEPPTGFAVLSIADVGTIELQLAVVPA